MPKGPIPRHAPGAFDDLENLAWDWHQWQVIASSLYNAAIRARLGPRDDDKNSRTLFFGRGEAAMVGDEWIISSFDRVAGMLFGMAVEAWLKGLCLLANRSTPLRPLFHHDLRKLAVQADVDRFVDDDDRDFLELCQSL